VPNLNHTQLAYLRQRGRELYQERDGAQPTPNFNGTQIDAAFQAIENWFETQRGAINSAINGAGAFSFSVDQKTIMVAAYLIAKAQREAGIL
jgi:hypothetical protein